MSSRAASWLAWSVCALTLSVLAVVLVVIVLGWSAPLPRGLTPWRDQVVSLVGIIGALVLGGLMASRRSENSYGWLWLGFGLGLALQLLGESYAAYALVVEPGTLVAPRTISRVLGLGGPLALAFAPFLLLLFPTGYRLSRRWRPLAWIAAMAGAMVLVLNLLFDNHPDEAGGGHRSDRGLGVRDLRRHRPLGAFARGPLSAGGRGGARAAEVVRAGRRPERLLPRRGTTERNRRGTDEPRLAARCGILEPTSGVWSGCSTSFAPSRAKSQRSP